MFASALVIMTKFHKSSLFTTADLTALSAQNRDIRILIAHETEWTIRTQHTFPRLPKRLIRIIDNQRAAYFFHEKLHNMDIIQLAKFLYEHPQHQKLIGKQILSDYYLQRYANSVADIKLLMVLFPRPHKSLLSRILNNDALFMQVVNDRNNYQELIHSFPLRAAEITRKMHKLASDNFHYFNKMTFNTEEIIDLILRFRNKQDRIISWHQTMKIATTGMRTRSAFSQRTAVPMIESLEFY